jgi:uncharacterized membrane protein YjgN (DUF898 family)
MNDEQAGTKLADDEEEGAPSEPSGALGSAARRRLSFEFKGDTREYFRIWIVNLALTLVTLGLFSAWAKVRKKRYLYSHTLLDGTPFQYLGKPIPILKGRLLATVLALTWYFVFNFEGRLIAPLLLVAVGLLPWIIVRSAAFNARYSAYRNMTFHFSGSYGAFVTTLLGPLLLCLVTCGLSYPWLRAAFNRYMISRTSFGGADGQLSRQGGEFAGAYLVSGLGMAALAAGVAIFMGIGQPLLPGGFDPRVLQQITMATYAAYFVVFVFLKARITNLVWSGTRLGGVRFDSSLAFGPLFWLYLSNSVAVIATAGLLTPWAVMRVAKYRAAHFEVWLEGSLEEFEGSDTSTVRAAGAEVGEMFDLDVAL